MRQLGSILILLSLLATGAASGIGIAQDAAGHSFAAHAAEEEYVHNEFHNDVVDFEYERTTYRNGASVDGTTVTADVHKQSRTSAYHWNGDMAENRQEGVFVYVNGESQGFTTENRVSAEVIEVVYDFGPLEHGEAKHVVAGVNSNTWGNGLYAGRNTAVSLGEGQLESEWLNRNPMLGAIQFVSAGIGTMGGARVDQTSVGANAWVNHAQYAGDYTGGDTSVVGQTSRCQGWSCQWESVGQNLCTVGYRPPFFFACLLG